MFSLEARADRCMACIRQQALHLTLHLTLVLTLGLTLDVSHMLSQILVQTAKFVHAHGGQVEVLMRVRQGSNPQFSFLSPGDPMHPYYRWIAETNPQVRKGGGGERCTRVDGSLDWRAGYVGEKHRLAVT